MNKWYIYSYGFEKSYKKGEFATIFPVPTIWFQLGYNWIFIRVSWLLWCFEIYLLKE